MGRILTTNILTCLLSSESQNIYSKKQINKQQSSPNGCGCLVIVIFIIFSIIGSRSRYYG